LCTPGSSLLTFFFACCRPPRPLHPFPTRRSSDLLAACAGHGAPAFPLQRRRTAAARREKVLNGAPFRRAGDSHHDARKPRHLDRSEEHTSELQSRSDLVCRLLLEKK